MGEDKTHKVTLYNDNKLSFDYVTACLTQICGHTPIQAEQCAILAHNRGQIDIASGSFDKMYKILETLDHVKVEVSLETYESNLH
jgi:ATP-dependent Clp protease adaptor protein ClpS